MARTGYILGPAVQGCFLFHSCDAWGPAVVGTCSAVQSGCNRPQTENPFLFLMARTGYILLPKRSAQLKTVFRSHSCDAWGPAL